MNALEAIIALLFTPKNCCWHNSEGTFLRRQYEHLWAVILAGGDGVWMREYLKTQRDVDCPKQFAKIVGTRSIFWHAIERVKRIVPRQHMLIVVNNGRRKYVHPPVRESKASPGAIGEIQTEL